MIIDTKKRIDRLDYLEKELTTIVAIEYAVALCIKHSR